MSTHNQEAPENIEKQRTPDVTKVGKDNVITTDKDSKVAQQQQLEAGSQAPRFTAENQIPFTIDLGNGQVIQDSRPMAKAVADGTAPITQSVDGAEKHHGGFIGGAVQDISRIVQEGVTPIVEGTNLNGSISDQITSVLKGVGGSDQATLLNAGDGGTSESHGIGGLVKDVMGVVNRDLNLADIDAPLVSPKLMESMSAMMSGVTGLASDQENPTVLLTRGVDGVTNLAVPGLSDDANAAINASFDQKKLVEMVDALKGMQQLQLDATKVIIQDLKV